MNKKLTSLVACLSIGLSSCAHAMGRSRCEVPELPARPQSETCIANGSGGAGCFDPRSIPSEYSRPSINGYICFNKQDYQNDSEWLKFILRSCR